jgi:hypothetical protein
MNLQETAQAQHSQTRPTAPHHIVVVAYAANTPERALSAELVARARAHLHAEHVRYRVNEHYRGASDCRGGDLVNSADRQWLRIGRDHDCDRPICVLRDRTLVERHRSRDTLAPCNYLAEQSLIEKRGKES